MKRLDDDLVIVELESPHLVQLGRDDLAGVVLGGFSFAALHYGVAIAAGGIIENMWPGRGYAWFISGSVPRRAWPGITRAVAKAVEIALEEQFHRVEMYVSVGNERAAKWAEHLGFVCEGVHPKLMGDGGDGYTYGRTN